MLYPTISQYILGLGVLLIADSKDSTTINAPPSEIIGPALDESKGLLALSGQ
jgi:hypothetical protein